MYYPRQKSLSNLFWYKMWDKDKLQNRYTVLIHMSCPREGWRDV